MNWDDAEVDEVLSSDDYDELDNNLLSYIHATPDQFNPAELE